MSIVSISFIVYLVAMVGIGIATYKVGSEDVEGFLLGKRSFGPLTTALTHQATAMSGYMFQAMPGKGYSMGLTGLWTALGSASGPLFGFGVIGRRLRIFSKKFNCLTVPDFLAARYYDKNNIVRIVSVVIIFPLMTAYVTSQNVAIGQILEQLIGIPYAKGVYIGGLSVLAYTFLGGYYAVVWTDVVQGLMMFIAAVVVPTLAIFKIGGLTPMLNQLGNMDPKLIYPWAAPLFIIGVLSNGIGYLGQPQLMVRYMSMKDEKNNKISLLAAVIWSSIALYGVTIGGLSARVLLPNLKNPELALTSITMEVLHPVFAGMIIAAAASAIMSSANSFLLVAASSVATDIYLKIINKQASQKQMVLVNRIATLALSAFAIYFALHPAKSIFQLVLFAWSGLACAFGPATTMGLFWKRATREGAVASMIVGFAVAVIWQVTGLDWKPWYGMIPAGISSILTMYIVSLITSAPPKEIQDAIEEMGRKTVGTKKEVTAY